jgi:hypothetical protein
VSSEQSTDGFVLRSLYRLCLKYQAHSTIKQVILTISVNVLVDSLSVSGQFYQLVDSLSVSGWFDQLVDSFHQLMDNFHQLVDGFCQLVDGVH